MKSKRKILPNGIAMAIMQDCWMDVVEIHFELLRLTELYKEEEYDSESGFHMYGSSISK